jgi:phospholipase C
MLRMFARYATNNVEIVPIDNLREDALFERLPAFTFVEPAMHHHPPNDDHPPADMWRGQRFIRDVYEWLSDAPTWEKTLLIITYDEHGGLYDHVVPPVADLLEPGRETGGVIGVTGTLSDGYGRPVPSGDEGGGGFTDRWREEALLGDDWPVVLDEHQPPPPPPPPARVEIRYGVRVPTFLVSPHVPPGRLAADGMTLDFCSILKTVLARFAGDARPFLSDRVDASHSLDTFLSEPMPRYVAEPPPNIPVPSTLGPDLAAATSVIDTPPVARKELREGKADSHEIMGSVARMLGR